MIPIMNGPSVPYAILLRASVRYGATDWFLKALTALWDAGIEAGIDPAVLAAQCAHETAWGHFGGAVTPQMGNTCGLKVRNPKGDDKFDHASFGLDLNGFPTIGAKAHADHLRLYCGFPVDLTSTNDPRAVWIQPGTKNFGSVLYVIDLGAKWAPSPDYGRMVETKVLKIRGETI